MWMKGGATASIHRLSDGAGSTSLLTLLPANNHLLDYSKVKEENDERQEA
jgi:hypothetical protein